MTDQPQPTPPDVRPTLADAVAWLEQLAARKDRGEIDAKTLVDLLDHIRQARQEADTALGWLHDWLLLASREFPEDKRATLYDLAEVFSKRRTRAYTRGPAARLEKLEEQGTPTAAELLDTITRRLQQQSGTEE